jgi:hypothetical protein
VLSYALLNPALFGSSRAASWIALVVVIVEPQRDNHHYALRT